MTIQTIILAITFLSACFAHDLLRCKVTPSDPEWPSTAYWQALNQSVSGHLIVPSLPGSVCHPEQPDFNPDACSYIQGAWTNSAFHTSQPASVDYNDDTCPPNATRVCSAAGYPAYVINATNTNDIQEGVKFAARTGVRLIVKNTGHDYPGRSVFSSLSSAVLLADFGKVVW